MHCIANHASSERLPEKSKKLVSVVWCGVVWCGVVWCAILHNTSVFVKRVSMYADIYHLSPLLCIVKFSVKN